MASLDVTPPGGMVQCCPDQVNVWYRRFVFRVSYTHSLYTSFSSMAQRMAAIHVAFFAGSDT